MRACRASSTTTDAGEIWVELISRPLSHSSGKFIMARQFHWVVPWVTSLMREGCLLDIPCPCHHLCICMNVQLVKKWFELCFIVLVEVYNNNNERNSRTLKIGSLTPNAATFTLKRKGFSQTIFQDSAEELLMLVVIQKRVSTLIFCTSLYDKTPL